MAKSVSILNCWTSLETGYNTFQLIFIDISLYSFKRKTSQRCSVGGGQLVLKVRCSQNKKICWLVEYIGKLVNKITLNKVTYSSYLTIVSQVNKKEPFFSPVGKWKNVFCRVQMCIPELRHEKGTFLALKKKLLFIFTKGYFRDLASQNTVHFYHVTALWSQVQCTTFWEVTSFLQSFLQDMNCSSVLGFSSSHVKKKKKIPTKNFDSDIWDQEDWRCLCYVINL